MKPIFHNISFLVHGRKSFRSYSLSISGWTILLFLFCDSVLFSLVAKKCGYFFKFLGRKHWMVWWWSQYSMWKCSSCAQSLSSVTPLSMCFSFPLQPQRLHLSSESLSGDKASTSLLYLHPPSFSLPLHPSPCFGIPYIRSAFPGSQWNERRACTLTGWNRTGLGACSLSLFHTHTHPHTLTFTKTNRLSLADCSVSGGHTQMHALPCSHT